MRIILRSILVFMAMVLVLILFIWFQRVSPEQHFQKVAYQFPDTLVVNDYDIDSLKQIIGENKHLPEGFELVAAIALSAYPELKHVKIDLVLTESGAPMESRFDIWSMLGRRRNRQYQILLNDAESTFFEPILLRSLPFNAQVGILAHELGHVVYYHEKNLLQIAKWGILYLIDADFRAAHERSTDLMPVYHGLGSQMHYYAWYVRHHPDCQDFYDKEKWFMDRYYMTEEELMGVLQ